jgi:hypothetical protein
MFVYVFACVLQKVDFSKAQRYADSIGALCFETSAKSNVHIHDAFAELGTWRRACGLLQRALSLLAVLCEWRLHTQPDS